MEDIKIESFEHLKELLGTHPGTPTELYLLVAGGLGRTDRYMIYDSDADTFDFSLNYDEWEDDVPASELAEHDPNLFTAIANGCLYYYGYQPNHD